MARSDGSLCIWRLWRSLAMGLVLLSGLTLAAQSYQTSFSEVRYDRARTPATLNGAVSIDIPTGAASINIPLGPGIGARGATFGPVLSGRFSPQARTNIKKLRWLPPMSRFDLSMHSLTNTFEKGDPNFWETYEGTVVFASSGSASLHPGQLTLPPPHGTIEMEGHQGSFEVMSHGGATFLGKLPVEVDPSKVLHILALFDIANRGIGKKPYNCTVDANGVRSVSTLVALEPFLSMTTGGDLVVGLNTGDPDPAELVQRDPLNAGSTYAVFPQKVAVVRQDTAFVFEYLQPTYKYMPDVYSHKYYTPLMSAGYRLIEIRNRFKESIRITHDPSGQGLGDGIYYRAEWFRGDQATGLAFKVELDKAPGVGEFPAGATALGYLRLTRSPEGGSAIRNAGLLHVTYEGAAGTASWDIHTSTVEGDVPKAWTSTDNFEQLRKDEPWDKGLAMLQPHKVIQSDGSQSQTLVFTYNQFAAEGLEWGIPNGDKLYPTVLSKVESSSGEFCQLNWEPYLYRLNWAPYPGAVEEPGLSRFPGIAWGVTSDKGTHPTFYRRIVPQMNWVTSIAAPGPDLPVCVDTRFQVGVLHPDGQVTLHRFMEPGGFNSTDPAVRIRNMVSAKHNEIEVRTYAKGVIENLTEALDADVSKTPATSLAYQWVVKDRFSLRARQNPSGLDSLGCVLSHTRTRTWDKDSGVLTQQEQLEWDEKDAWKVTQKCTSINADPGLVAEVEEQPAQGHSHAGGAVKHDHLIRTTYDPLPAVWLWNRPVVEVSTLVLDDPRAYADTRVLPWSAPPTYRTFHATNNRLESIVRGDLTTTFTYGTDDLFAALPQGVSLVSTAPGSGAPKSVSVSYGYDEKGHLNRITQGALTQSQINDALGRPTSRTDAAGFTTSFIWDGFGRLTQISPPDGETPTSYIYHSDARGVDIKRSAGQTTLRYNPAGNLVLERRKGPNASYSYRVFGYDTWGRKTGETVWKTGPGNEFEWSLPNLVEQASVEKSPGFERCVQWGWDADGTTRICLQTEIVPPQYEVVAAKYKGNSIQYDNRGRVSKTVDANGVERFTVYSGLQTTATVAGRATRFDKDAVGRLVQVTNALGQPTHYSFDALGKPSRVIQKDLINDLSQTRIWEHDDLGRLVKLFQPESGTTEYSGFNVLGNPCWVSYAGREVWTTFDELGRVANVADKDRATLDQSFQYGTSGPGTGKLQLATSLGGVTRELFYNGRGGRLSKMVRTVNGQAFAQAFSYNADGNLESRQMPSHTDPSLLGPSQQLTYDPVRGLPETSLYGEVATTLSHHEVHWGLNNLSTSLGTKVANSTFEYRDDQTSLLTQRNFLQDQLNRKWTYGYMDGINITSVVGEDTLNVPGFIQDEDSYVYDELWRLKAAIVRDPFDKALGYANRGIYQNFGYDAFGNRILAITKTLSAWTTGIDLNNNTMPASTALRAGLGLAVANMTCNITDAALKKNQMPPGETGAVYDPQGNLIAVNKDPGGGRYVNLTYDALGRVIQMNDKDPAHLVTETYSYDDLGLRVMIKEWQGTTLTRVRINVYNEQRQLVSQWVAE